MHLNRSVKGIHTSEDDNEEKSDKDGEGVDRGDAAAVALLELLVDKEGN